ncbi:MAG: hypothetical protein HYW90_02280 [Candidatus Sungbacteria bacterium]|nr:hypothetical protein [Candidatus Sungbacteria bacterium]
MNRQAVIIVSAISAAVIATAGLLFVFTPEKPPVAPRPLVSGGVPPVALEPTGEQALKKVRQEATISARGSEIEREAKIEFFGSTFQLPPLAVEILKPVSSLVPGVFTGKKEAASEKTSTDQPVFSSPPAVFQYQQLSEKEIFEIIWPKHYRDYLFDMRGLMVNDGFISSSQHVAFASDADIYNFVKALDAYALFKGWITAEDYNNFIRGIDEVLPELVDGEKGNIRSGRKASVVLPGGQRFVNKSKPAILQDILDGFAYVFMRSKPAYAAWVTKGDCYKDDNPADQTPGSNLATICCNCGFFCTTGCAFVEDCGPYGAACNVQVGCLNSVCEGYQNAIFDQTTGICGCG